MKVKSHEVEIISVSQEIAEVAARRTKGILRHWPWTGRNATLENLAISIYLQGIQDAVQAAPRE